MIDYSSTLSYKRNSPNCVLGGNDHLIERLKESFSRATQIDIIVAFLMESGVRLLQEELTDAIKRGVKLRILCGNYLNITQPTALYLLKDMLGDSVDLRFYNVPNKSFHPKAYLFEESHTGEIFVGSSNVSKSALTDGIEWNYRISSKGSKDDYNYFKNAFENIFLNESTIIDDNELSRYSKAWKRPKVYTDFEASHKMEGSDEIEVDELGTDNFNTKEEITYDLGNEEVNNELKVATPVELDYQLTSEKEANTIIPLIQPRGAQIEALYLLKKFRADGGDVGLVVAATGIGKTYLAAFDSLDYKKVLFIAHREEILIQAQNSFSAIRPNCKSGFFSGQKKDRDVDIVFATIQTIGKKEYLCNDYFKQDEFDYIIIDEFHHIVARQYRDVLEYFKPKFLLGLTATPERMDNRDVFALCEYNVIYEIRLKEAINKGWLVPFRYYGIYDDTNYDEISFRNGKYDVKELEKALSIHKRAEYIVKNYMKYGSRRALGFCASRAHAIFMADYFQKKGISCAAVISGGYLSEASESSNDALVVERREAIHKLKIGEIKVIFSVDMFNEGLDIPELDLVMLLRPTESPTTFLQQLGRGLRKCKGKKYLNVLDFIGNYKNIGMIPSLLTGEYLGAKTPVVPKEDMFPDDCIIDFDFRIIDLFSKLELSKIKLKDRLILEYCKIKEDICEIPSRVELYTNLDYEVWGKVKANSSVNPLKDYLNFLIEQKDATKDEARLSGTFAHEFIKEIENTSMSKMYKMPVLEAFYNQGEIKLKINDEDLFRSFKEFYSHGSNSMDLLKDQSTASFRSWSRSEYIALARRNPLRYLAESASEFFYYEGEKLCLNERLEPYINDEAFKKHFKDVIEYRTLRFYKERYQNKE